MKSRAFSLNKINYAYPNGAAVLKGLTLDIHAGEKLVILGANGCGKSTLLKMLTLLIFPQSGSFEAFGEKIEQKQFTAQAAGEYHQKVGFIFQDSNVQLFCSTVYEELAFGPLQLGMSRELADRRIAELAGILGIKKLLDKSPIHLSGGEKKKIAIGSILILNPEVLILDEPTNNLDPRTQTWLINLLRQLNSMGKTIITATHELQLAPKISDRAILFDEAHNIVADLPVNELLKDAALLKQVNLVDDNYQTTDSG